MSNMSAILEIIASLLRMQFVFLLYVLFQSVKFTVDLYRLSYDSEMESEIELLEVIKRQNVDGGVNFSGFPLRSSFFYHHAPWKIVVPSKQIFLVDSINNVFIITFSLWDIYEVDCEFNTFKMNDDV